MCDTCKLTIPIVIQNSLAYSIVRFAGSRKLVVDVTKPLFVQLDQILSYAIKSNEQSAELPISTKALIYGITQYVYEAFVYKKAADLGIAFGGPTIIGMCKCEFYNNLTTIILEQLYEYYMHGHLSSFSLILDILAVCSAQPLKKGIMGLFKKNVPAVVGGVPVETVTPPAQNQQVQQQGGIPFMFGRVIL